MSIISDKIQSAEYVYSATTKWSLKRYICDVAYFTEEPLDDLYYVICSIVASSENGCYDKKGLGILLGFSLANHNIDGKQDMYYDVAESRMFDDILNKVKNEHLIHINGQEIRITKLGSISLKEGKHYRFYNGTQEIYEHFTLKSNLPMSMLMFPFFNDMGICTELKRKGQIWPNDEDIEEIIYHKTNQLKKRIELHSEEKANIYFANLQQYFDVETKIVPVQLFKDENSYIPIIMNGDKIAVRATDLVCEDVNAYRKENIILECLFKKLWDDKSATLDYKALAPYFDLVDYEELTKDSRTIWSDKELFDVIVDRSTPTCWRNISRHCDISVIRDYANAYRDYFDWRILTDRIDDDFLMDKFMDFPWDFEILSTDRGRKDTVIENLILKQKETTEDWNWDELGKRLSQEFVLSHLDVVKVDLSKYTNDSEYVRQCILANPDKLWNWNKIESEFDLNFIYNNISIIGQYLNYSSFFDRIFTSPVWSQKFVHNSDFIQQVVDACKEGEVLSSSIFNDKDYRWTPEIIDLFVSNGLLSWRSTPYMIGFECNPNLVWTNELFKKYSSFIATTDGYAFISSRIEDVNILIDNPTFSWDWDAISSNIALIQSPQLFNRYGQKLNWSLIFANQTDSIFLQSIENIHVMIGNDEDAWKLFSFIATLDYVITKYKDDNYHWNWTVLTERFFEAYESDNRIFKLFFDKWDWTYLSEHVSIDFLYTNLEKFCKNWNWEVSIPRILNSYNRFDYEFLDEMANLLATLNGILCQRAWTAFTSQYSFDELKKILKETVRKPNYRWDMNYFFNHKEFDVLTDLEKYRDIIDWNILSGSPSVDNSLKYNPKLGIKEPAWKEDVRKLLSDDRNHWNYALLSHFESLKDERWFLTQYKDKVDWEYLSQSSLIFCEYDKQKLNEIIESFHLYINFKVLSERNDVDVEQIIKINPHVDYDYNNLIERNVIKVTLDFVESKPNYEWDWYLVTSAESLVPTPKFILSHLNSALNWEFLSKQDNQKIWGESNIILNIAQNKSISEQIDWYSLSSLKYFPITHELLNVLPISKLNWTQLSRRKSIVSYIDKYKDYIDWKILSLNKHIVTLNHDFLEKYKDYLDWSIICKMENFVFTNEIIESFSGYIDWNLASDSKDILFDKQFVDKYKDHWNWSVLLKNKAFYNRVDISDMPYAKQLNIVEFMSKFPGKPKAYHFTHMDNAVKIIRDMKLQSRNLAMGKFSNIAGTNVHRSEKAHRFARFYFMPKSPTQFYNECLGKDIDDERYYKRAYGLGLPKCPLPVFFVFDVEELLSVMPDKCYYSNGNMQKDSSSCFKVTENPNRIKAREIYINSYETIEERQQEFLVDGELDFSKLKEVKVYCYDKYQADTLRREVKGTKWEDAISVGSSMLYERINKKLFFEERENSVSIDTDYNSPFEFRVTYSGTLPPTVNNRNNVIRQRGNNIYMKSCIDIQKDVPYEIFFEVNNPRIGSWLIFKNM